MSAIARVTAPILLILAAYIGGGAELIFPHSIAGTSAVSYTHLDVYKRQAPQRVLAQRARPHPRGRCPHRSRRAHNREA